MSVWVESIYVLNTVNKNVCRHLPTVMVQLVPSLNNEFVDLNTEGTAAVRPLGLGRILL